MVFRFAVDMYIIFSPLPTRKLDHCHRSDVFPSNFQKFLVNSYFTNIAAPLVPDLFSDHHCLYLFSFISNKAGFLAAHLSCCTKHTCIHFSLPRPHVFTHLCFFTTKISYRYSSSQILPVLNKMKTLGFLAPQLI